MAQYPIKMLKDENGTPFVPLVAPEAVKDTQGTNWQTLIDKKLEKTNIIAGDNITLSVSGNDITINSQAGGTSDYSDLTNKPKINNVELSGNKSLSDLGITNLNNVLDGKAIGSARTIGAKDSEGQLLGEYAWAEGQDTIASGLRSHAEGWNTRASNDDSHAEGHNTVASMYYSHAEGLNTAAAGYCSHAEGRNTTASGNTQHVQGKYNVRDTTLAHIVGNGKSDSNKSNAHTLDWQGNAWFAGDVYTGSTSGTNKDDGSKKLATEEYVTNLLCINNAGFHNSIFRGKDVTSYLTDGTLYNRISSGTFRDLFVGDYIIKNNITWRIAGFDIHLNKGDQPLTIHHAVIVPDSNLTNGTMNSEGSTEGGYVGSTVYQNDLPTVLTNYITPVFGNHVIEHRALLTNEINPTGYNRMGTNDGCSNGHSWYSRRLDLMDECEVYGSIIWSSSGFDCGSAYTQLPLFALAPQYILSNEPYWLKDVSTSHSYASVTNSGIADGAWTASILGVRPRFLID